LAINPDYAAPCGLYCGVCSVLLAGRENDKKLKRLLVSFLKRRLPNSDSLSAADVYCEGCLSKKPFYHCMQCSIRDCTKEKGFAGCHECEDFPCGLIHDFPIPVGKKVILRAIPYWKKVGTEKWIQDEEARYLCPQCGHKLFRGAIRCNRCSTTVDLD